MKALLIGCGRMGAGTGSREQRSESHAAVLAGRPNIDLFLHDSDSGIANATADVVGGMVLPELSPESLGEMQLAVICTPTGTHVQYLKLLLSAKIPVIICEKPISGDLEELKAAIRAYERGESRIIVNYTRRFLPAYADLRTRVASLLETQGLKACAVRYQRGFLNNASHAIDLLQFLTGWNVEDLSVRVVDAVNDEFLDDPTISCMGNWNGTPISILGLPFVRFSMFEVDLFFERDALRLRDRGDTVEFASSSNPGLYYAPLKTVDSYSQCIDAPLTHLYDFTDRLLKTETVEDNFLASADTTRWMLQMAEQQNNEAR